MLAAPETHPLTLSLVSQGEGIREFGVSLAR